MKAVRLLVITNADGEHQVMDEVGWEIGDEISIDGPHCMTWVVATVPLPAEAQGEVEE